MGKYDKTIAEFVSKAKHKERETYKLFINAGYEIIEATKEQDIYEHWDYMVGKNGKWYRIDEKQMKKVDRHDKQPSEIYHYIELKGTSGYNGWLFGKATHINFELKDEWLIVDINKLREYTKAVTIPYHIYKIRDENGEPICYKIYHRRDDKKDEMILVPISDLIAISQFSLKKEK